MRLEEFLADKAERRSYGRGDSLFSKGQQADAAFYISAGRVEIFKTLSGRDSILATLGPGEIFGEMALLRFDEYTLSARAADPTEVLVITPGILQEQIRATHPLVKAILDMLIDRVHNLNQVLIDLDSLSEN